VGAGRRINRGIAWTAEHAYASVDVLECGDRTTVAELAAEGFPRKQVTNDLLRRRRCRDPLLRHQLHRFHADFGATSYGCAEA
jgi:hypothetical protein